MQLPDGLPEDLKSELMSMVAKTIRESSSTRECVEALKREYDPKLAAWNADPRDPSDRDPCPISQIKIEIQARLIFLHAIHALNAKQRLTANKPQQTLIWAKDTGLIEAMLCILNNIDI
jgi:hypothetical protein